MKKVNFHILTRCGFVGNSNPCHDERGQFCNTGGSFREISQKPADRRAYCTEFNDWVKGLSREEKISIYEYYKIDGYQRINVLARSGGTDRDIRNIDSALSKSPLKDGVVAYRGFRGEMAESMVGNLNALVGKEFTDNGFVSTTLDIKRAGFFTGGNMRTHYDWATGWHGWIPTDSRPHIVAAIRIPAGTKAAIIEGVTKGNEWEILISRGHRFRVTETKKSYGKYYIDGKLVKYPKYQITMEII